MVVAKDTMPDVVWCPPIDVSTFLAIVPTRDEEVPFDCLDRQGRRILNRGQSNVLSRNTGNTAAIRDIR